MTSKYIRQLGTPLALSCALALGACAGGDDAEDGLAQDSALATDLELAGQDTAATPQLTDVPATAEPQAPARTGTTTPRTTPRPAARTPARTTPNTPTRTASGNTVERGASGSERAVGTIPAGASINLASNQRVCTNTHKVGDRFTARVTAPVQGSNGATIPAGATAVVEVVSLKRSENANDPIVMTFRVASVRIDGTSYPVNTDVTYAQVDRERSSTRGDDAKKVATGAVIGAIAGQILGKDTKGTVIGAATGAAAGTAVAMGTGNYEGCIPEGGSITLKLNEAAQVAAR